MSEFREQGMEEEASREEFQQHVLEMVNALWERQGWQCQKEIFFQGTPFRPGEAARVKKRPKDLMDPEDSFEIGFYMGQDIRERRDLEATLDFLVRHELAHSLSEQYWTEYEEILSDAAISDLNRSKQINPEHLYSGANEIATDVIALSLCEDEEEQHAFARSFLHLLATEVAQEKSGTLDPFYRDQARFEVMLEYLKEKELLDKNRSDQIRRILAHWRYGREKQLDEKDLRRFEQMREYLKRTIQKAKSINSSNKKRER